MIASESGRPHVLKMLTCVREWTDGGGTVSVSPVHCCRSRARTADTRTHRHPCILPRRGKSPKSGVFGVFNLVTKKHLYAYDTFTVVRTHRAPANEQAGKGLGVRADPRVAD